MSTLSSVINCGNKALPKSIDVNVSVSKPQTETTTDFSTMVFVSATGNVLSGVQRISYYDTLEDLEQDWPSGTEAYKAGTNFFSQPTRAQTLAVARAFGSDQSGYMITGELNVANLIAVSNGGFDITIDGALQQVSSLDFTSDTNLTDIATTLNTALTSLGGSVEVYNDVQLLFKSLSSGDSSMVSVLSAPTDSGSPTDISGPIYINGDSSVASISSGYTYTNFANELSLIREASICSGKFIYGWSIDAFYRDKTSPENYQKTAATWAEGQAAAILGLTSNSVLAYQAASTSDIGYVLNQSGFIRTFVNYHDKADYYPEVSILALMLSVNYKQTDSTLTAKFKDMPGIPTVGINTSQLTVLENKRYNTFTLVGNNARTFREGNEVSASWYIDDLINLDNFSNDLQTAVFNVFLRTKKVSYTVRGQALIRDAIYGTCTVYVANGTFGDRIVQDSSTKSGTAILPAFEIVPTPIQNMSASDRVQRIGPPFSVNGQLESAMHTIAINVNARN